MVGKLIFLICTTFAAPEHQYMCSKSLEAAALQYGVTQTVNHYQHALELKAVHEVKRGVSDKIIRGVSAAAAVYGVIQRREISVTMPGWIIADDIGLTARETGGSMFLRWHF